MTAMASGKGFPATAIRALAALCLVATVGACSSGRTSASRELPAGGGLADQAPTGAVANGSENKSDAQPCLTKEQKQAKMKEIKAKDSWFKDAVENQVVGVGGNLLGSMVGLDNAGEYAVMANDTKKATVKGNAGRDSIDVIAAKDCDSQDQSPSSEPSTSNGTSAGR